MKKRRIFAAAAALPLAMGGMQLSYADDIVNRLDDSIDAVAEVMPLNVGGDDGSTQLYLVNRNGDGKNGCNIQGTTDALTLDVSSSDTSVATVSPSTVTFDACSDTPTLTVSPLAEGTATISVTQAANNTGATFLLTTATFTVNVAPPSNTAPDVSVAGVAAGAQYLKNSVPAATCQVTDAEDGPSSFPASLSAVTGPYSADGIGSQTASCSYTDKGGLTAIDSVTYSVVDSSAPGIGYTLNPSTPDGTNGWYKSNVTLTWSVTDTESPNSIVKTGCWDGTVSSDQASTTYSCAALSAGGSAGPATVSIKRDATAPVVIGGNVQNTAWRNSALAVEFAASDATSDLANAGDASFTITAADESANSSTPTVASHTVYDKAGNSTTRTVSAFIDLHGPTDITFSGGPAETVYYGDSFTPPTCSAVDALSGFDKCEVTGGGTAVGAQKFTATATDLAGNTTTEDFNYTVLPWTIKGFYAPVDMNGVLNTVKGGSTVPLKFEAFAGSTELMDPVIVDKFVATPVTCGTGTADALEVVSTGGTSLRYDTSAGQFIQNWQTPKRPGACYNVSVLFDDGTSSQVAKFQLK